MLNCAYSQHYLTTHAKLIFFTVFLHHLCLFFSSHNFEELLNVELTGANSGFADLSESIYRHWRYLLLIILLEESTACHLSFCLQGIICLT